MTVAADHEATMKGREEELKAIATAKKMLEETSSGAIPPSYCLAMRCDPELAIAKAKAS